MGGKFSIFILFLISLLFAPEVYGGGKQEDPIDAARSMIIEKRYNEALVILAEVARKDPERLDEAESLIRRIRNIRGEYYNKYQELIEVLYEQRDVEKALNIIKELESLDNNPNAVTQAAVLKAKDSALFIYNQNKFNDIMTQAAEKIRQEDYAAAVTLYLSGFELGKEGFDSANYGNIVESRVAAALKTMKDSADLFIKNKNAQTAAPAAFLASLEDDDRNKQTAALQDYISAYRLVASTYRTAVITASDLEEQNKRIVLLRGGEKEDFFLGYTQRLIGGRKTSEALEGIRGAAQILLTRMTQEVSERILSLADASFQRGQDFYRRSDWTAAEEEFLNSERYADMCLKVEGIWIDALPIRAMNPYPQFWEATEKIIPVYRSAEISAKGSLAYVELSRNSKKIQELSSEAGLALPDLENLRATIRGLSREISQRSGIWKSYGNTVTQGVYSDDAGKKVVGLIDQAYDESLSWLGKKEADTADRIAGFRLTPLNEKLPPLLAGFKQAENLLNGIEKDVVLGENQQEKLVLKYPAESGSAVKALEPKVKQLQAETQEFVDTYRNEVEFVRNDPRIVAKIKNGLENIEVLKNLMPKMSAVLAKADENSLLAERYKNEGTRKIAEARSAIGRNNFDQARENLAAARQRFSLSLSYQENSAFRNESDATLLLLNTSITDAENKLVVAEVRKLITEGKRLYYLNVFDEAESVLLRAQTRWRATQAEDNQEVSYWLGFVRAALFVKSNREILETDPLYIEMSQLLNLAREDYVKGRDLIERGNTREALDLLNRAEEKLRQVSITFPFNQTASVLSLRIAQIKDRQNFSILFRNKFRDAQNKMSTNPQEGYIDLKDLEQIDPNFAGLKDAIYKAEILLGIRVPPPDPKALAGSEDLYQAAFRIVSGNIRSQYPIALEQLNKAIELNPNNSKAVELKDRIQIDAGGQTTVVLSSVAEEQYRLAEKRFIEGNFFEALAIVQRLLQNKESKKYPPLLELKRRIESRI